MDALFGIISIPMGYVLRFLAEFLGGNFALSVLVFTVLINLALIPLSIKSQKSSVQQTRIKPKLDELKARCGDDKQKYSEEMQKLYQEENVSMAGGCLPMILRLVLMLSIYSLILSPLTYMTGIEKEPITNVSTAISEKLTTLQKDKDQKETYNKFKNELGWQENGRTELAIVGIVRNPEKYDVVKELLGEDGFKKIEKDLNTIALKDKEADVNYNLFTDKINLTESPKFSFDIFHAFKPIWIMPIVAFLAQILSSLISMRIQKKINPEAPSMSGMLLTMPLISLFIGFGFPGGVTFYWACSSLIGGFIQSGVQIFYGPHKMLAKERAKELTKQCDFEEGQIKKFTAN